MGPRFRVYFRELFGRQAWTGRVVQLINEPVLGTAFVHHQTVYLHLRQRMDQPVPTVSTLQLQAKGTRAHTQERGGEVRRGRLPPKRRNLQSLFATTEVILHTSLSGASVVT